MLMATPELISKNAEQEAVAEPVLQAANSKLIGDHASKRSLQIGCQNDTVSPMMPLTCSSPLVISQRKTMVRPSLDLVCDCS